MVSFACRHRRRVVAVEVVVQPVVAPVPPVADPAEATNAEAAVSDAVDGSPEEDVAGVPVLILFPRLWNEVRVLQEMVQQVGVQDGFTLQLRAKDVACDDAALLLAGQPELDFLPVEIEVIALAFELGNLALLVFFHTPAVGQEGVDTEVNGMFDSLLWTCSFNEPVRTVGLERCAFATVENGL